MRAFFLIRYVAGILLLSSLLAGCASLTPNFETPSAKLISLQPLPINGMEQRFAIGLRVSNPNSVALNLVGVSYAIELEGFEVISGVANDIPGIPAYGESVVDIEAAINLIDGVRFFSSMLTKPDATLHYKMTAKLDTGLPLIGKIPVLDQGTIDLAR